MFIFGPTSLAPVNAQEDLIYVPVNPCRIVDTRLAGGAILTNTFRNFYVSGDVDIFGQGGSLSGCPAPRQGSEPLAISAYIIAVPDTNSTSGVLTAYPSDQPPPATGEGSIVNFAAGQIVGNTTNVTLCDPSSCPNDGEFAILARSTNQHVVIDLQGYYYPATIGVCPSNTPTRFIDNGDGTICDSQTGLMWEKKEADDGIGDSDNPHDVDNEYSWTRNVDPGSAPTGTMFTDLLQQLNSSTNDPNTVGFAGYTDWRIPTIIELQTLLLQPAPCFFSPCIDPIFAPTAEDFYWSSTAITSNLVSAFGVSFDSGEVFIADKISAFPVRAVRGGR